MIVGHQPFLGKLSSLLLTGYESAGPIAFHNGGVLCLGRTADNRWQVEWLVTPELVP
jgi:phosphohistidine phosphatase